MPDLKLNCRGLTTFKANGDLDEDAYRKYVQRMVDSNVGLYVCSGGSGQGHSLTNAERKRVYELTSEVGKGKIVVSANLPETPTPAFCLEQANLAIAGKVDTVHVYGPPPFHNYRATEAETRAYFDGVFSQLKYPASIGPNIMHPEPSPRLLADVVNKYTQIEVIMMQLHDNADSYYVELRDALKRDVFISVAFGAAMNAQHAGANGVTTNGASILPKTYRLYVDQWNKGDMAGATKTFQDLTRFENYTDAFRPWHKVALKAFKLPGGEGAVRPPFLTPGDDQIQKFIAGLPALKIAEVDELSKAAGIQPAMAGAH